MMSVDEMVAAFQAVAGSEGIESRTARDGSKAILELLCDGRVFVVATDGGEAFFARLDSGLSRVDFEWDEVLQVQLIVDLARVGAIYVRGEGKMRERHRLFRPPKQVLVIERENQIYQFD